MKNGLKATSAFCRDLEVAYDKTVGGFPFFSFRVNQIDSDTRAFFADTLCSAVCRLYRLGVSDITFCVPANQHKLAGASDDDGMCIFAAESDDNEFFHVYVSYVDETLASSDKVCPFGVILVPKQLAEASRIAKKWLAKRKGVRRTGDNTASWSVVYV